MRHIELKRGQCIEIKTQNGYVVVEATDRYNTPSFSVVQVMDADRKIVSIAEMSKDDANQLWMRRV